MNKFFGSSSYAIVGASQDRSKYGNKVLRWYQTHLPSTPLHPVNPKAAAANQKIEGLEVIESLEKLSSPEATSISIITPPYATLQTLKLAQKLDIPYMWLQPGSEDAAVAEYVRKENMTDRVIMGGPCILVSGASLLDKQAKL